jgi:hypothetical protein
MLSSSFFLQMVHCMITHDALFYRKGLFNVHTINTIHGFSGGNAPNIFAPSPHRGV